MAPEINLRSLTYPLKSLLAFVGFHSIGLLVLHFTFVGAWYTMPQWVALGTLTNFLLHGEARPRGDWYLLGILYYAAAGLIFGYLLRQRIPPRAQVASLLASLALFQLIIYVPIIVLSLLGIWSPLAGW